MSVEEIVDRMETEASLWMSIVLLQVRSVEAS